MKVSTFLVTNVTLEWAYICCFFYFSIQFAYVGFTDTEAPKVICVEDQYVATDEGKPTAMVEWEDPLASDNSGNFSVTCDPPSETEFPIGQTSITCEAADGSGNRAECSFPVSVTGNECAALSPSYVFRCKVLCVSGCVGVWGNHVDV